MKLKRSELKKQQEMTEMLAKVKAHNSQIQPSVEYAKLREEQRLTQKNEELQAKLIKSSIKREEGLNQKITKLNTHNAQITKGFKDTVKAQEEEKLKEKIMELSKKLDKKIEASRKKKEEELNKKLSKLNTHNAQITKGFKDNLNVQEEHKLREAKQELDKKIEATRQKKEEFINQKLSKLSSHNAHITKGLKETLKAQEEEKLKEKVTELSQKIDKKIAASRQKKEQFQKQRVERGRNEILKVLKIKERMSSEEKAI